LMAGPGSITTALVLASRAQTLAENVCILLAALIILFISYLCYLYAERILSLVKESSLRLLTRIMGLILTALAVEFIIQGINTAFPLLRQ
jgi:multiple antibiotic resistance protein